MEQTDPQRREKPRWRIRTVLYSTNKTHSTTDERFRIQLAYFSFRCSIETAIATIIQSIPHCRNFYVPRKGTKKLRNWPAPLLAEIPSVVPVIFVGLSNWFDGRCVVQEFRNCSRPCIVGAKRSVDRERSIDVTTISNDKVRTRSNTVRASSFVATCSRSVDGSARACIRFATRKGHGMNNSDELCAEYPVTGWLCQQRGGPGTRERSDERITSEDTRCNASPPTRVDKNQGEASLASTQDPSMSPRPRLARLRVLYPLLAVGVHGYTIQWRPSIVVIVTRGYTEKYSVPRSRSVVIGCFLITTH